MPLFHHPKGSPAAKAYMAKLRAMRGKNPKKGWSKPPLPALEKHAICEKCGGQGRIGPLACVRCWGKGISPMCRCPLPHPWDRRSNPQMLVLGNPLDSKEKASVWAAVAQIRNEILDPATGPQRRHDLIQYLTGLHMSYRGVKPKHLYKAIGTVWLEVVEKTEAVPGRGAALRRGGNPAAPLGAYFWVVWTKNRGVIATFPPTPPGERKARQHARRYKGAQVALTSVPERGGNPSFTDPGPMGEKSKTFIARGDTFVRSKGQRQGVPVAVEGWDYGVPLGTFVGTHSIAYDVDGPPYPKAGLYPGHGIWGGPRDPQAVPRRGNPGPRPKGIPAWMWADPAFHAEVKAFRRRHGPRKAIEISVVKVPKGYPKYMSVYGRAPAALYDAPPGSNKGKRIHHFGKAGKGKPWLVSSASRGPKFLAYVGGRFKAKSSWIYD